MTVTVELLVHADLGLPAGVALVLSSRARADHHQSDRSAQQRRADPGPSANRAGLVWWIGLGWLLVLSVVQLGAEQGGGNRP
jgi:hypothetical protein